MRDERATRRWGMVGVFAALLASGCAGGGEEGLTREQFVDVVTRLRAAALETQEPGAWEARKRTILAESGVSDSALVEFARRNGDRIPWMLEAWDSIDARLRPATQDTAPES